MDSSSYSPVTLSPRALTAHAAAFVRSLADRRPETRGTYDRALREFLRWFARERRVRFLVRDIERYKAYLANRRRLSGVSVSTYLTAVRRFCDYLVRHGVLRANPAREVGGNSRPREHSRGALSTDDVVRLLASVPRADERGLRDYAIIQLMLGCALSEIEVIRADRRDLRDEGARLLMAVQGKGRVRKDEVVELPGEAREAVEAYLAHRGRLEPRDPLFASAGNRTRGMRMTTRGVRDRINDYLDRSGVRAGKAKRVTPYSLRHTAAALMAARGATPDDIRRRLRLGTVATALLYFDNQ
jgi:site-specific recombinase XerC